VESPFPPPPSALTRMSAHLNGDRRRDREYIHVYRRVWVLHSQHIVVTVYRTAESEGNIRPHDDNPSIVPVFKSLPHQLNCLQRKNKKNYIHKYTNKKF
jgi:hypothetical protein